MEIWLGQDIGLPRLLALSGMFCFRHSSLDAPFRLSSLAVVVKPSEPIELYSSNYGFSIEREGRRFELLDQASLPRMLAPLVIVHLLLVLFG